MNFLQKNAATFYYFGLLMMAVALPLSKFLNGLSLFFIVGAWLFEGGFKVKFQRFFSNKIAVLWTSLYVLHLLGLFYTSDFPYAFNDLRIKLPILLLPLVISSSKPLEKKKFNFLLQLFVAAVVLSSLISMLAWLGFIKRDISDARTISFLISHIRLALLVCFAAFVLFHFLQIRYFTGLAKYLAILTLLWLVCFLVILESLTGIVVMGFLIFAYLSLQIIKRKSLFTKLSYAILLLVSIAFIVVKLNASFQQISVAKPIDLTHLETHTALGNPYVHQLADKSVENGNYVFLYLCTSEVDSVWSLRSPLKTSGLDLKKQPLRVTLFRFLSSKNLRKDAAGVSALSAAEIHAVENGITNVNYQNRSSINFRLQQIFWEINTYLNTGNPSGHSVTMRLEYFKTALLIWQTHPILGVGTGDVNQAFLKMYEDSHSPISTEWRLRAHNQYLTMAVSFGLLGLLWFLFTLFYPLWLQRKNIPFLYISFLAIALLSMLNEDTLETQAGVTFFAFFNSLLWFNRVADNE